MEERDMDILLVQLSHPVPWQMPLSTLKYVWTGPLVP